jgi:hypothetical protein
VSRAGVHGVTWRPMGLRFPRGSHPSGPWRGLGWYGRGCQRGCQTGGRWATFRTLLPRSPRPPAGWGLRPRCQAELVGGRPRACGRRSRGSSPRSTISGRGPSQDGVGVRCRSWLAARPTAVAIDSEPAALSITTFLAGYALVPYRIPGTDRGRRVGRHPRCRPELANARRPRLEPVREHVVAGSGSIGASATQC